MNNKRYGLVAVAHALVDIRMVVDKFPGPDEEVKVINQVWGLAAQSWTWSSMRVDWG